MILMMHMTGILTAVPVRVGLISGLTPMLHGETGWHRRRGSIC